jgi:hypothetical protein
MYTQIDMGLHYFNEHVFEPGCACTDGIREHGAYCLVYCIKSGSYTLITKQGRQI